ncbi:MAG TPA: HlyD family type I secretion periplasmic adaptor subunit [Stellaceae bacterium]|nr:HlyD family type I secretion periplasmic adaptor subunit [Stellaceae bacterium]
MKSARALVPRRDNPIERAREEIEFLPAALEIVEKPPSPIGRAISLTIALLFALALAWASIGQVDIVATAQGKIVPSGRTKVVQPLEIGTVRAIHVEDGQAVKAGEVLIELDPTMNDAELTHLESDWMAARLDVARMRAALDPGGDPLAAFAPPPGAPENLVATERQLLLNEDNEQRAKLAELDHQRAQKEAERQSYAATVQKLQATIPILEQRTEIRKYLADKQYGSKITYLETLTDLVQQQKDLPVEQSHLAAAQAALQGIEESKSQTVAEYHRTRLTELATAEQKEADLAADVTKAKERARLQVLSAPVDGVVQQLAVHTIGGVVTAAQPLLEIVPQDSKLEVEAMVSNLDVGFVHVGQDAEIKVDTFNFTKYGLLRGTVESVSADAVTQQQQPSAQQTRSQQAADSVPEPGSLAYAARVSLDRSVMDIDGREVRLAPGMAVTVEIKTGQRRVISYLLSPLLRFQHESLRER